MAEDQSGSIIFQQVNKFFLLQHQKTIKELVHAFFRRQKTLERVHALNNVTFTINRGESIGIIGKNGAGKSTLLKLIAKVSSPTSGKVIVDGAVSPLIELGAGFHPELTGRENIFLNGVILGMREQYLKGVMDDIVNFAEIREFIDTPVKYYSSGMYMRLAFSVAIFTNPDILLIDEIFAVGDVEFQKKCLKKMQEFKKKKVTIVFVSHSIETIKNFCERVLVLQSGEIIFDGPAAEGVEKYLH